MTPLSSVYRDPENGAFSDGAEWFRVASGESVTALRRFRGSPVYAGMVSRGEIVHFDELSSAEAEALVKIFSERSAREFPSDVVVFAVEKVNPVTYPWEWANETLRSAALLTLSVRSQLLALGLDLKDASAFNVQFRGSTPIFMDIGSIELWKPNPTWKALKQFIYHFLNPLAAGMSSEISSAQAWRLGGGNNGVKSGESRRLMPLSQKFRPGLSLLQAAAVPAGTRSPGKRALQAESPSDRRLCLQANASLINRLRRNVLLLKAKPHRSTWASYGGRSHYSSEQLDKKKQFSRSFVGDYAKAGDLVLDIGGNDGVVGLDLIENLDVRVIVADSDSGALDMLSNVLVKTEERSRLMPLVSDITNLDSFRGLLGEEFEAFKNRVQPVAVLCHAVVHHLVISQAIPMKLVAETLSVFNVPVQIEFVTEQDQKVRDLLAQINRWQGEYSLQALISSLEQYFQVVEIAGFTTETRVVVEASVPLIPVRKT